MNDSSYGKNNSNLCKYDSEGTLSFNGSIVSAIIQLFITEEMIQSIT